MTEEELTWIEFVRRVTEQVGLTDDECNRLLWNASCFPFGSPGQVEATLTDAWVNGGKSVEGALRYSHLKLDEAMVDYSRRKTAGEFEDV